MDVHESLQYDHVMKLYYSFINPNPIGEALERLGVTYDPNKEFEEFTSRGNRNRTFGEYVLPNGGGTFSAYDFLNDFLFGGGCSDNSDVNIGIIFEMIIDQYPLTYVLTSEG